MTTLLNLMRCQTKIPMQGMEARLAKVLICIHLYFSVELVRQFWLSALNQMYQEKNKKQSEMKEKTLRRCEGEEGKEILGVF